jgi:quinol monooxygenase YgiN
MLSSPGQFDDLAAEVHALAKIIATMDGCLSMDVCMARDSQMVTVSKWRDRASLVAYSETPTATFFRENLAPFLAEPGIVLEFDIVAEMP